jgi:AP-1-like factor
MRLTRPTPLLAGKLRARKSPPLVKQGLVDIADVFERLKGAVKCDGHGPVFEENSIWQAIEESRRSGGDELI